MTNKNYHTTKLIKELKSRIQKNASYSIRSFARDLKIDSSSLTSIIAGKRKIPKSKIDSIAEKISSTKSELESFAKSAWLEHVTLSGIKKEVQKGKREIINEDDFSAIADIQTYTLLSLLELDNFKYDKSWIKKKIKIEDSKLTKIIKTLTDKGIIKKEGQNLVRVKSRISTTDNIESKYIVKHHMDTLDLAKSKCLQLSPQERYFSTLTIPADPESIEEAKKLIMDFEDNPTTIS